MSLKKGIHYIVIPELPEDQQEEFGKWLYGQTCPVIEEEGINRMKCAYKWDYDYWLEQKQKGIKYPKVWD